jgi:hypothetical protein
VNFHYAVNYLKSPNQRGNMIDLLAKKSSNGDLYIVQATLHMANHEWGLARIAIERGIAKGDLSNPERAYTLMQVVCAILEIGSETENSSSAHYRAR